MLQINVQPYASDALEDAMRLAQTKALNSYSWSDCLNYLNYAWMDMYQRLAQKDEGYYSKTVRLTQKMTKLPAYVKNTIRVYAAQSPVGFNRDIFRASGYNDLQSSGTYHISGFDLYCPDAVHRTVWLNYIPMQPQLFFTRNNRDPKLYDDYAKVEQIDYNLYIFNKNTLTLEPKTPRLQPIDLTTVLTKDEWTLVSTQCDFPYMFVTWQHNVTGEHYSGFFKNIESNNEFIEYNPFAFTGRNSNVEYLYCKWNDKTGLGVVIKDWNDDYIFTLPDGRQEQRYRIKELGWTPDTLLIYPAPEMYRYLVARLADKFAALNESNIMGVTKELVEAEYAFVNFINKDKSAWGRIDNVNGPTLGDLL